MWIRNLMKRLSAEGRTVFVSSHLMNEISVTAEHLIVIGRGKLIADCSTAELIERNTEKSVLVKSPDTRRLREAVVAEGGRAKDATDGAVSVSNLAAPRIGELAAREGLVLHELTPQRASLEEAFMELTRDSLDYAVPSAGEQTDTETVDPQPGEGRS